MNVGIRLWDGKNWPDDRQRSATLVLKHPGALRAMFLPANGLTLAEAYLYEDFNIEGNIESVFKLADSILEILPNWRKKIAIFWRLLRMPVSKGHKHGRRGPACLTGERHSIDRDRQAVTYHYDVSNDFYRLFLDQQMIYSCAYFQSLDDDLDKAQERKLDYLCRKMRLHSGQCLLDLGCGWGGLVIHAARYYGVDATGITLSTQQSDLANERIKMAGLSDRCLVIVKDYRQVDTSKIYDTIISVGMFEHVGEAKLPTYFKKAYDLLRPGGVFLNHGIANRATNIKKRGPSFSDTYVFPDGELVPINVSLHAAEMTGFEVRDVESLREHYTMTLRHWVHNLETHHTEALQFVDEPTYRVWRLFMSGSAHGFNIGRLNVYQTLYFKPDEQGHSRFPLNRKYWYNIKKPVSINMTNI